MFVFGPCIVIVLQLAAAFAASGDATGDWTKAPPGTSLGAIAGSAQSSPSLRADLLLVDPAREPSGRLLTLTYTPQSGRERMAFLVPIVLAEPLWKLDQHIISRAAQESGEHPELNSFSKALTRLGNVPATAALCGLLYAGGDARSRKAAGDVASAGLASTVVVGLIKRTFRRPRPDHDGSGYADTSYSFPSGHAAGAFSTATVIAHYYPDLKEPAYLGAALISVSRVTLRRHYPTDVVAGAIVGTLVARQVLKNNGHLFEWRW